MFKHLIGRGHEEFSTMRQQDAFEFLLHLFKLINISNNADPTQDPIQSFRFALEQRLQCLECLKVRYRVDEQDNISIPVPVRRKQVSNGDAQPADAAKGSEFEPVSLKECLDIFTSTSTVELTCPSCGSKAGFSKSSKFKTFPRNLAINPLRFEVVNWVPTKLDIPVQVTDEPFDMSNYKSHGLQPNEEELPQDTDVGGSASAAFAPNEAALGQLESMGFPRVRCEKALHATGNADAEAAMNWLFSHMDDPDIDEPLNLGGQSAGSSDDADKIAQLGDMGISAPQARKALRECNGDVNRALDWVFSHPDDQGDFGEEPQSGPSQQKPLPGTEQLPANFELQSIVCHKGASIHAGHYVAFIREAIPGDGKDRQWVLFNDEKVVKAVDVDEMKKFAYIYFFRLTGA
jgi:ubiquitin carboxyl-terminal hydrolase 5/13